MPCPPPDRGRRGGWLDLGIARRVRGARGRWCNGKDEGWWVDKVGLVNEVD